MAFCGWQMSQLRLWGHWPLFLFLSGWCAVAIFLDYLYAGIPGRKYFLLLSGLSALLLGLSFPPFGFTPLIFFGFVPLFYIQEIADRNKTSELFYVYNAFVLWNIFDTYWVANAALLPGIVAIWLNSFFMLVPWIGAQWVGRKIPSLRWWSFASFWVVFEWIHHNWEISWPWLTLGNAWSSLTSWIQWYEYTGVFGGTLWTLIMNILFFQFILNLKKQLSIRKNSRTITLILCFLIFPVLISILIDRNFLAEGKYGEICVVQPNYEPHYEKFAVPEMEQITRLGRLAEINLTKDTRFILFPETCIGDIGGPVNSARVQDDNRIITFYDFIESHFNIPIVMGLTTIKFLRDGELDSPFKRTNQAIKEPYEIANSAVILKNRLEKNIPVYNKSRLVPGAEIFPYRRLLPFLSPLVDKLGGTVAGLATQKERTVFEAGNLVIAPVICYESIYGNYMRGYIKNGAQAIFIMTNDGWWDDTPGYKQHMAFSKLRAIEFRKPVIRSANTGISCFIDARGNLGKSLGYNVHSSINQGVTFSPYLSFYAKFGDLLAYLALLFATFFVILRLFRYFF